MILYNVGTEMEPKWTLFLKVYERTKYTIILLFNSNVSQ